MKHNLPLLRYDHAALEPHVDARTMLLHHTQHHASYVANLNAALEKFPALQERSALWLLLNSGEVPESIRTVVRNNAAGT
jgi:Fe-Mn family superoxide dismutase